MKKKDHSLHSTSLLTEPKDNKKLPYRKQDSIKYLGSLANEAARKKYPNVPYLAPREFRDNTANGLTKCIIQFLSLSDHQAERIRNTGRHLDNQISFVDVTGRSRTIGSTKWIQGTGTNGTSDLSATIFSMSVKIEVKIGRDTQSKAQQDYQRSIESAGGVYVIASSFAQFLEWYNQNNPQCQKV